MCKYIYQMYVCDVYFGSSHDVVKILYIDTFYLLLIDRN